MEKTVVAAALGECVHVAGVIEFSAPGRSGRLADGIPGPGGADRSGARRRPGGRTPTWWASPTG